MWLLKTDTLQLVHFVDERATKYAILSHTWNEEEVTFQEMRGQHPTSKKGYIKVEQTCKLALRHNYEYVWIDTCCINKESSAELSEAINSMWNYYSAAAICYVYLVDVLPNDGTVSEDSTFEETANRMKESRWFTRGWTLQELIAPTVLSFFNASWQCIGTREQLCDLIAAITTIDKYLLLHGVKGPYNIKFDLSDYSIAARMAWAANRQTTRREDRAYSLLGLFGINMPLLYGEGDRAFMRLQEEIIRRTDDLSILAWDCGGGTPGSCTLLAPSPDLFRGMSAVVRWKDFKEQFPSANLQLRPTGLKGNLSIIEQEDLLRQIGFPPTYHHYAVLDCYYKDDLGGPLALCITLLANKDQGERQTLYALKMHRTLSGESEALRVISHNDAKKAQVKKCIVQPIDFVHQHATSETGLDTMAAMNAKQLRNHPGGPDTWIQPVESAEYGFKMLDCHPEQLWTKNGLLRPPAPAKDAGRLRIFSPLESYGIRCTWQLHSRHHREYFGFGMYEEVIDRTWTFGIAFKDHQMNTHGRRCLFALYDPLTVRSGWTTEGMRASLNLEQGVRIEAVGCREYRLDRLVSVIYISAKLGTKD